LSWHGLREGDEVELEIKEKARTGEGIGRLHGCVILVKDAKVGEKLKVKITMVSARHARGNIVTRLK
jgi:predicted RNA-binding protein with TRAM domain